MKRAWQSRALPWARLPLATLGLLILAVPAVAAFLPNGGEPAKASQSAPAAPAATAGPASGPKPAAPVKVVRGPFRVEVELTGIFEAERMEEVAFSPRAAAGQQFRVLKAVEHGSAVRKGDELIVLDTRAIDKAIQQKEAEVQSSEPALKQAAEELRSLTETTPDQLAAVARADKRAEEDLDRFTKIERALAEKAAAQNAKLRGDLLEYAKEELRQLEKMYKADDLVEATEEIVLKRQRDAVERATFALEQARIEHDRRLHVDLPRQAEDLTLDRKRKGQDRLSQETLLPLKLAVKRLAVEKAGRDHAQAAEDLTDMKADRQAMTIRAPADGIAYYGRCVRGQWTTAAAVAGKLVRGGAILPDEVLITVVDPKPLRVRIAVPEKELHRLRVGLPGQAIPVGFPDRKLKVELAALTTVPLAAGQFDARLKLLDEAAPITPGMNCTVRLLAYEKRDAIAIPAAAVQADPAEPDKRFVRVRKDGALENRPVKIGQEHAGKVEIVEGLAEGDVVVVEAPK